MLSQCHFNDIDVITDMGTIAAISIGNFATTQINRNNDNFYIFQNNTNKDYNANIYKKKSVIFFKITLTKVSNAKIYMYNSFYISFKIILNEKLLVFKIWITELLNYFHELIFLEWKHLDKHFMPDIQKEGSATKNLLVFLAEIFLKLHFKWEFNS